MAGQYHMSDFSQSMDKCPHCDGSRVFIRRHINFVQIGQIPIMPSDKHAVAFCRDCMKVVDHGSNSEVDRKLAASLEEMVVPKWMYTGAVCIPAAILGVVIMVIMS